MLTVALIIIACMSCIGVLHSGFSDNLLQRVGMSAACIGSVLSLVSPQRCPDHSITLLLVGVAFYSVGTAKNAIKYRHHHRVKHAPHSKFHAG